MKLSKLQLRNRARNRKRLAKQNNELPKMSVEEHRMLDEIRIEIIDWSGCKLNLRKALRNYINVVGEKKSRLDKPKILLRKLGIEKNVEDMSYLYKLIRAVYAEYMLNLETGKVPYSVLATLPKKNIEEIWTSANRLKEDRPYPSENDIAKAKRISKKISHEEAMAKADEYLGDISADSDDPEDKISEHKDKVTPNLRRDVLELSRESPKKNEIMLNIFKYFKEKDLLKILAIMKNFTPTEIDKTIDKLKEEYLIVIYSQSDLAVVEEPEVPELY